MATRLPACIAWLLPALCLTLACSNVHARAEGAVPVLCSIRPVQLIAMAIGGEDVQAQALASASASPHAFVLRPSERRQLAASRLFLWMGPALERPLERVLQREPPRASLALLPALGAEVVDPHAWLDPRAAASMARAVADALANAPGVPREAVELRLGRFTETMRRREALTEALLAPLRGQAFLAMHDGYRGFVARYGLRQVGALPGDHEHQPGARSLAAMRRAAETSGAVCLLRQADDSVAVSQSLARDTGLRIVEVDPLAARAADFDTFLATFAEDVARCLSGGSEHRETPTP